MDNLNFTSTKLDRKKMFWFCILTCFALVLTSLFVELSDNKVSILTTYFTLCGTVIGLILGTKANDTYQKRVIKEKEKYD